MIRSACLLLICLIFLGGCGFNNYETIVLEDKSPSPNNPQNRVLSAEEERLLSKLLGAEKDCPGADSNNLDKASAENTAMCLINYARTKALLKPVLNDPLLFQSASLKAKDIINCQDFSHTACGLETGSHFEEVEYGNECLNLQYGENLAIASIVVASPRETVRGWLLSPGHRENMLKPTHQEQGIVRTRVPDIIVIMDEDPINRVSPGYLWVSHFASKTHCD